MNEEYNPENLFAAGAKIVEVDWALMTSEIPISEVIYRDGKTYEDVPPMKPGSSFRGSGIDDPCPRLEILCSMHDVWREREYTPDFSFTLALGNGIHDAVQQDLFTMYQVGSWTCLGCGMVHGGQHNLIPRPDSCWGKKWVPEDDSMEPCPNRAWDDGTSYSHNLPGFRYKEIDVMIDDPPIWAHPDSYIWRGTSEIPKSVRVDDPNLELVELKSASERGIEWGYGSGAKALKQEPYPPHRRRTNFYLGLTGVGRGRIIYFDKSGRGIRSSMHEHVVRFDKEEFDMMMEIPREINAGILAEDPLMGRRACKKADCARAKKCPVKDLCWLDK